MTNCHFEDGLYAFMDAKNIYIERVNIFFLDAISIVTQGIAGLTNRYFAQQSPIGYELFP